MSTISKKKVCRASWKTPCPNLGTGGFIIVDTNSLTDQLLGISN
jgi:hypothetical protein